MDCDSNFVRDTSSSVSCARSLLALCFILLFPLALKASPADHRAYVANHDSWTISIIDTSTNQVVETVPLAFQPGDLAITPDGTRAYIVASTGTIKVMDLASKKIVADVSLANLFSANEELHPERFAITPDGKQLYVEVGVRANEFANFLTGAVVDTASNTGVVRLRDIRPNGSDPGEVAITPDGKRAYFSMAKYSGLIAVVDTATNQTVDEITGVFGRYDLINNYHLAVTPSGKYFYVTNFYNIAIFDTATDKVVTEINVGWPGAGAMAFAPDGFRLYAVHGNNAVAIDTEINQVTNTIPVGTFPLDIAITPDGKKAFVLNCTAPGTPCYRPYNDGTVSVIDTETNKVVASIGVGKGPAAIAIIPDIPLSFFTSKLFISQSKSYFELLSNITLGSGADWLNPVTDPVTIQVGSFAATIPPGSFKGAQYGPWTFDGTVNGAVIHSVIWLTGTKQYQVLAKVQQANIAGAKNPVTVRLTLGPNSGTAPVTGKIYAASAN